MKYFFLSFFLSIIITTGCHQVKKPESELQAAVGGTDIKDSKNDEAKPFPYLLNRLSYTAISIPLSRELDSKENTFLINNLDLLGKIWGFLKYHHPEVGKGKYDWDNELFRFLPEYLNVNETGQRDETLLRWIEKYGEIPPCTTCRETAPDAFLKPDFSWIENSTVSAVLKEKIREIYRNRHQGAHHYIKMLPVGNPEFLNENSYASSYPDTDIRLLALYRYWNMIQYFFPSKYMTDKNWNEVLKEYIPKLLLAETALEYQMAVLQLTGEINDSHAMGRRGFDKIDSLRGNMHAPFWVRFIENKLVVMDYYSPELKDSAGLETGDIITHVNGKKIEYIIDSIKSYYPASNEAIRMWALANDIVRSNSHTIRIDYIAADTQGQKDINLYRRNSLNLNMVFPKPRPSYTFVNDNYVTKDLLGYVTLASIRDEEIDIIQKTFKDTQGIIIDIRNYPSTDVRYSLGSYFVSEDRPFAKSTIGNVNNPGEFNFKENPYVIRSEEYYQRNGNNMGEFNFNQGTYVKKKSEEYYSGKLVVLVFEYTMSNAEHTAMAFRAGDNTVIIGCPTSGADGNVSMIELPGGLQTAFSGIGVYYPDGRETQRIGIIPDLEVKPTIQGIREGRDELLEKAIEIIKNDSIWNEIKQRQSISY